MGTSVLPNVMSDLLELALNETEKAAAEPGVQLDMSKWYLNRDGVCHVCMAGAVMRGFGMVPECTVEAEPYMLTMSVDQRSVVDSLHAIDEMRGGYFFSAAHFLGIHIREGSSEWGVLERAGYMVDEGVVPEWEADYVPGEECAAITTYREIVSLLRTVGL